VISHKPNFLKSKDLDLIRDTITLSTFPWYLIGVTDDNKYKMLSHTLYTEYKPCSPYSDLLLPVLDIIKPLSIVRAKVNLYFKTENLVKYPFHVDNDSPKCKTAILYLNDNDGYTQVGGEKIQSQSNYMIKFNSNQSHTGTNCTDKDYRILLNFVYIEN
jgi:hypothetical protein